MRARVFSKSTNRRIVAAVGALACAALVPTVATAAPVDLGSLSTGSLDGGSSESGQGALVATVDDQGSSLTLRLDKVDLRGKDFRMAVQKSGGALVDSEFPAPRSYLGSVDGHPDAVVAAIVDSTGTLRGQVIFDRGASIDFVGSSVVGRTSAPTDAAPTWPTAAIAPASAASVGKTMKQFDIGLDLSGEWYSAHGNGSPAVALDRVEESIARTAVIWMRDVGIRPVVGQVVLRADAASDPYKTSCENFDALESEWSDKVGTTVDQATVVCKSGGGNAYYSKFLTDHSYAHVGAEGDGNFSRVLRHELGHNFYADDYHGGSAEGRTIMNGNDLARFDGTEFAAIVDAAEVASARLDDLGRYTATALPPYAALDTAEVRSGATATIDAVANDHDSNGDSISVTGVEATSLLGGTVKLENGKVVFKAGTKTGTDKILYTLTDANGGTSTGWIIVKVKA
ncbi:Ig-like domain-containing protein [Rhodococcus globerulus]|uniref:Ig-like domain-containing protein n=1 Tax=Rhodococcus globerulus TaxID=33008 RepID=UPI001F1B323E|nr:Ig-like domain-containing protein [Rhodococcus globerulus]MCE4264574.1 cadherin-like domain-containing protein [Rhodococcus globerulus]